MADYRYVKGQTNFSAAGFTTPAGPPSAGTSGHTMTFDDGFGFAGTNPQEWADTKFASVTVTPGCSVDAGAAGSPVEFDCAGTFKYQGGGSQWYVDGGTVDTTWAGFVWNPTRGCKVTVSGVTISGTAYIYGGNAVFTETTVLASMEVSNAQVIIKEAASDVLANLTAKSGSVVEVRRRVNGTIIIEDGATVIYDVDENSTGTDNIILAGPRAVLRHIKGKLGGVSSGVLKGTGTYDYSRLERSTYAVAIVDTPSLTEITGKIDPTFSRTTPLGQGSRKVPA